MGLLLPHTYHKCPDGPLNFIYEIINDHPTTGESCSSCLNIVVKLPFRFTVHFSDVNHRVGTCFNQYLSTQML